VASVIAGVIARVIILEAVFIGSFDSSEGDNAMGRRCIPLEFLGPNVESNEKRWKVFDVPIPFDS
jgi:hypothetical protein